MPPIKPDIQAIFCEALEQTSPEALARHLDAACAGDPSLRAKVEGLLGSVQRMGRFLEGSIPGLDKLYLQSQASSAEPVGTQIGPYKLREVLGEGGMGIVYVAEQEHPIRRKVALKVIKAGMDTRDVIARFEAERQALALMDHPNIARVLDAGTTEAGNRQQESVPPSVGRPYFVMELVRGVPITEYCDRVATSTRERLKLFIQVCQAIQHAHQKGIIHRDIKPSNVLVTLHDGTPVPKVIDFGVAKAVSQRLTEQTLYTRHAQMVGTPLYMSPEQAELSGLDVDTRSDVYSLGVLLYELLTGATPFDKETFSKVGYDEMRRIIREDEPPRPSRRLSTLEVQARTTVSGKRGVENHQLVRLLEGELDWIVMKALEKDRQRRYESASAFSADVERYLADEPVQACPPSARYRFRKLVRRNRGVFVGATSAVAVVLMGVVTLAASNYLIRREQSRTRDEKDRAERAQRLAEDRADEIRQSMERLISANSLLNRGRWHAAGKRWDDANAAFTKAVELRPDHATAWLERGDLFALLGLWDLASEDFAREFALQEPDTAYRWYRHALLRLHVGDEEGYRDVCRGMQQRFGGTSNRDITTEMVRTCVLASAKEIDLQRLVESARSAAASDPESWHQLYVLGIAHYRAGQYEDAVQQLLASLRGQPEWSLRLISNPILAMAYHRLGRTDEARQSLEGAAQAIDQWTLNLYQIGPGAHSMSHQGATGNWPIAWWDWLECRHYYREARLLIDGVPPADDPRLCVLRCRAFAGLRWNNRAEAEYARALKLAPEDRQIRLESHRSRGYCRIDERNWRAAAIEFSSACELDPDDVYLWRFRAVAEAAAGDIAPYAQTCRAMLDRFEQTSDPLVACNLLLACVLREGAAPDLSRLLPVADVAARYWHFGTWVRGALLYRTGRDAEAIQCFETQAELIRLHAFEWCFLAMAHHRLGHVEEARRCLGEAAHWIDEANRQTGDDLTGARPNWGAWWEAVAYPLLLHEAAQVCEESAILSRESR